MSFVQNLYVNTDATTREIRLLDTSGGEYVSLVSDGTTTTYTLTMPPVAGGSNEVLRNNGGALSWAAAGDVDGPGSAVNNGIARFDGTTGKIIKDTSGLGISDAFNLIDLNGNDLITFPTPPVGSAVNAVGITNATTGNGPIVSAAGTDTNINLEFLSKGTGVHIFDSTGVNATELRIYDTAGNNYFGIKPNDTTTDYTLTMPPAQGGTNEVLHNNGSGVMSWSVPKLSNSSATVNADTSTTSVTYVAMNGMTITPGSGTYLATFSASMQHDTNNGMADVAIYNNGSIIQNTIRTFMRGNNGGDIISSVHSQSVITVGDAQPIAVYFKTTSGAVTIHERSLILIRLL